MFRPRLSPPSTTWQQVMKPRQMKSPEAHGSTSNNRVQSHAKQDELDYCTSVLGRSVFADLRSHDAPAAPSHAPRTLHSGKMPKSPAGTRAPVPSAEACRSHLGPTVRAQPPCARSMMQPVKCVNRPTTAPRHTNDLFCQQSQLLYKQSNIHQTRIAKAY